MAYGRSTRAPADDAALQEVGSSCSRARSWQALSPTCRLAVVEQAIRAANDAGDGLPFAL